MTPEERRREVVRALVEGASQGMLGVSERLGAEPGDVLSAYFTMTRNGILYVLEREQSVQDREHNRAEILRMLLELFTITEGKAN